MRICIISDLHADLEALSVLPRDYDELWVLGDLVNYGLNPAEAIDFVRSHASITIRGNHDHSVGFGADCGCSPHFRAMAEATRDYTRSVLSATDKQFLQDLPTGAYRKVDGHTFFLCHATPSDFLYEYRPPDSSLWERDEEASSGADVVLVGHTHMQFTRRFDERMVMNPGSLGQSKSGDPKTRFAVWQDGQIHLRAVDYPVETTIGKIQSLPLPEKIKSDLANHTANWEGIRARMVALDQRNSSAKSAQVAAPSFAPGDTPVRRSNLPAHLQGSRSSGPCSGV